jgi:F-type H+-transporting ATPase subunit delta
MNRTKQAKRDAKELFRFCLANGLLDETRVRQVVQRVSESRNRNRLNVLTEFRRLVKLEDTRHTATVESAAPLLPEMQAGIQTDLSRLYGKGLNVSFALTPGLIGGMRVRVSSDVYDGSIRARLADLETRFSSNGVHG